MTLILVDHLYHHHLDQLIQESNGNLNFIPVDFRIEDSEIEEHLPEAFAIIGKVDPTENQYRKAKTLKLISQSSA